MNKLVKRSVQQIKKRSTQPVKKEKEFIDPKKLLPTGSTILNLMCSNHYQGGYSMGKIVNVVGDSSAGKTLLALTGLARLAAIGKYVNYKLVYDDVEAADEFDLDSLFTKKIADRIRKDSICCDELRCSNTIEDAYGAIQTMLDDDQPFVYVLDSLDSLTSKEEKARAQEIAKGKDPSGSYKTERVRMLTEMLRQTRKRIKQTDSLLIVVSQVRDDLSPSMFGSTKTRAGGSALRHHSCHEIWLKIIKPITQTVRGTRYRIGNQVQFSIHKNKLTGDQFTKGSLFTLKKYGIDDIRSCINFLWENNSYGLIKKSTKINDAIKQVEGDSKLAIDLKKECKSVWDDIQQSLTHDRRHPFG